MLVLVFLLLLFLFQNRDALLAQTTLELNLIGPLRFRSTPIPLYALLLASILLGAVTCAIYCGLANLKLHRTVRSLRQHNDSLQTELKSLRNLPITEAEVPTSQVPEKAGIESAEETEEENSG